MYFKDTYNIKEALLPLNGGHLKCEGTRKERECGREREKVDGVNFVIVIWKAGEGIKVFRKEKSPPTAALKYSLPFSFTGMTVRSKAFEEPTYLKAAESFFGVNSFVI